MPSRARACHAQRAHTHTMGALWPLYRSWQLLQRLVLGWEPGALLPVEAWGSSLLLCRCRPASPGTLTFPGRLWSGLLVPPGNQRLLWRIFSPQNNHFHSVCPNSLFSILPSSEPKDPPLHFPSSLPSPAHH